MVSLVRDVSLDSSPYAISNDLYIISTEYYPSEPERAAEARRAVVASSYVKWRRIFYPFSIFSIVCYLRLAHEGATPQR